MSLESRRQRCVTGEHGRTAITAGQRLRAQTVTTAAEQVISASETTTNAASAGFTVYCPVGSVATGTGYDVPDAIGEIIVNSIDPGGSTLVATDQTSLAIFEEDGPLTTTLYTPRAYVICANR